MVGGRQASLAADLLPRLLLAAAVLAASGPCRAGAASSPAPAPAPSTSDALATAAALPPDAYLNAAGLPLLMPSNRSTRGRRWYYEIPRDPVGTLVMLHRCGRNAEDSWPPSRVCPQCIGEAAYRREGCASALGPPLRIGQLSSVLPVFQLRICTHRQMPSPLLLLLFARPCRHARGGVHLQAGAGPRIRAAGHQQRQQGGGVRRTLLEVRWEGKQTGRVGWGCGGRRHPGVFVNKTLAQWCPSTSWQGDRAR